MAGKAEKAPTNPTPVVPPALRDDGPTLEEYVAAGYQPENYPPEGYAEKPSPGLEEFRAKARTSTGSTVQPQAGEPVAIRVVRNLPNPATQHSGVIFAAVQLGDRSVHVSERITEEQAAKFCRVKGYSRFDGDEAEHARAIEDALDAARKVPVTPGGTAPEADSLRQQLAEQQRINQQQSTAYRDLKGRYDTLVEENVKLKAEIDTLKAGGLRAVA